MSKQSEERLFIGITPNGIEQDLNYGMLKIAFRNFRAFQSIVTKEKECMYSEYFTYASKLPKLQRFVTSSFVLAQALNLLKYRFYSIG